MSNVMLTVSAFAHFINLQILASPSIHVFSKPKFSKPQRTHVYLHYIVLSSPCVLFFGLSVASAHVHAQTHNLSPVVSPCVFPSAVYRRMAALLSLAQRHSLYHSAFILLPAPPLRRWHPVAVNNCCSLLSERFFYFRSLGLNGEQSIFPAPGKKSFCCRFLSVDTDLEILQSC